MAFRPNAHRPASYAPFKGRASGVVVLPAVTQRQVAGLEMFFDESILISAKKMDRLGGELKDFRTPLKRALRQVVIPSIQQNFIKGGRPRWVPLTSDTVRQKGGNARPLRRTDNLMSGMNNISLWTIDRERAVLNDLPQNIWYGKVHQSGIGGSHISSLDDVTGRITNVGDKGAIPARPFIVLQEQDLPEIDRIFAEWVDEQIAKVGLR